MPTGIIKFYNAEKGYGFIQPDDGGNDVFVHITDVQSSGLETLHKGGRVGFEIYNDRRTGKSKAGNLRLV